MNSHADFVNWFRSAAPYIHAFRGRPFVIAFGGEVVADGKFVGLTHDINLLHSLGVRLVLVHGARPQTEARLARRGITPHYVGGARVTDAPALECVIEAAAALDVEIQSLFSMGVADSPMAGSSIRVASGNFVTARPIGVVDGIDFLNTGWVRKIDAAGIHRRLEDGEIVLLPPLGYSPTGEIYNLTVEEVATATAVALNAEKLIFLTDTAGARDATNEPVPSLTALQAEALLSQAHHQPEDVACYLPYAVRATRQGVSRVHLLNRHVDGALILELFTRAGIGTMVMPDIQDELRSANLDDVSGILSLIEPLESEGVLVKRDRVRLESEIGRFSVLVCEGRVIGCVALYPFPESGAAELACLAVNPDYRNVGRGDALLRHVEQQALDQHIDRLFLLSTRTGQWFAERGFVESAVEGLPETRQKLYNYQRRSKVFVKQIVNP